MTLFELIDQLKSILDSLDSSSSPEILNDYLFTANQIEQKMSAIAYVYKEKQKDIDAIKALIDEYQQRIKARQREMEQLKNLLMLGLNHLGKTKLQTSTSTIFLRSVETVKYDESSKVPDEYLTHPKPIINKQKVKKDIKEKHLSFASLTKRQSITIRIK